jgi:hypothetical protein
LNWNWLVRQTWAMIFLCRQIPQVNGKVHGYCSLCIARCGTVATVTDGQFVRLDPDPTYPTGAAICAKGRAAPELVYHKDRLKRPLRRTRPKGDVDPGWEEISWALLWEASRQGLKLAKWAHNGAPPRPLLIVHLEETRICIDVVCPQKLHHRLHVDQAIIADSVTTGAVRNVGSPALLAASSVMPMPILNEARLPDPVGVGGTKSK